MKHRVVSGWTWAVAAVLVVLCSRAVVLARPAGAPTTAPASVDKPAETEKDGKTAKADEKVDRNRLTDWLSMGGEFRFRTIRERARKLQNGDHGHDRWWQRFRGRVWAKVEPLENLEFNIRIVTEPRLYCRRNDLPERFIREEALFDRANVVWKNAFGLPLTFKIGRQDLRLGSTWLVREGTPMDGSRTSHFDAIRLTYEAKPIQTTADLVWIDNHRNSSKWIRPFNDADVDLIEQDEQGAILYVSNKSIENHRIDGYFIYKRDHNPSTANKGSEGHIYTFGLMAEGKLGKGWKYRVEVCPQFGHKNGKHLGAFGTNNVLSYHFDDPMDNRVHFGYEYLSGDDDSGKYFDLLWGREAQYSDIYNGAVDTLDGRDFDSSNMHRPHFTWEVRPVKDVQIITDYHLMFADQNTSAGGTNGLSKSGCFRGQLVKIQLKHKINEYIHHRLTLDFFFPGDFYTDDRNDMAFFIRYGIVFTW